MHSGVDKTDLIRCARFAQPPLLGAKEREDLRDDELVKGGAQTRSASAADDREEDGQVDEGRQPAVAHENEVAEGQ